MEPTSTAATFVAPAVKPTAAAARVALPCPFSAQGMLQPSSVQPPPMFGPRGPTIPPRHLNEYRGGRAAGGGGGEGRFTGGSEASGRRDRLQPRNGNQQRLRFPNNQQQRPPNKGHRQPPFAQTPKFTASSAFAVDAAHGPSSSQPFCCEPCDRCFATADELHGHRAQHQRCTAVEGCPFEGHAQLVASHVQQQHSTGLYERIRNLTTPEEVERWREERRRKYPSAQNVELRQQIQAAKQQRGERLEATNSRFGPKTDRRQPATMQQKQPQQQHDRQSMSDTKTKRTRKKQKKTKSTLTVDATEIADDRPDSDMMNGGLKMFRGTAMMKQYKRPRVKVVNALSGLLGAYDSDEDSEDDDDDDDDGDDDDDADEDAESVTESKDGTAVLPVSSEDNDKPAGLTNAPTIVEQSSIASPAVVLDDTSDADNGPPEEDVVQRKSTMPDLPDDVPKLATRKRTTAPIANTAASASTAKRAKSTTSLDLSRRYRNQNTMLEKLLQKDIRHERNALLQCVRFVVAQRFFGVGQPESSENK